MPIKYVIWAALLFAALVVILCGMFLIAGEPGTARVIVIGAGSAASFVAMWVAMFGIDIKFESSNSKR